MRYIVVSGQVVDGFAAPHMVPSVIEAETSIEAAKKFISTGTVEVLQESRYTTIVGALSFLIRWTRTDGVQQYGAHVVIPIGEGRVGE